MLTRETRREVERIGDVTERVQTAADGVGRVVDGAGRPHPRAARSSGSRGGLRRGVDVFVQRLRRARRSPWQMIATTRRATWAGSSSAGVLGAAAALLLTPRTGAETRELLAERGGEFARRAQELATEAQGRAGEWLDKSRELFEEQTQRLMTRLRGGPGRDAGGDAQGSDRAAWLRSSSPTPDELEERATRRSAVASRSTTAVYAVVLAIASLGGSNAMKEMLLAQQEASNQWAYYQAKVIREHLNRGNKLVLETQLAEPSPLKGAEREKFEALAKKFADEEKRMNVDKKEIEPRRKAAEAERDLNQAKDPYFDYAEVLLQIAIVTRVGVDPVGAHGRCSGSRSAWRIIGTVFAAQRLPALRPRAVPPRPLAARASALPVALALDRLERPHRHAVAGGGPHGRDPEVRALERRHRALHPRHLLGHHVAARVESLREEPDVVERRAVGAVDVAVDFVACGPALPRPLQAKPSLPALHRRRDGCRRRHPRGGASGEQRREGDQSGAERGDDILASHEASTSRARAGSGRR